MSLQRTLADFAQDLYHQFSNDRNAGNLEGSHLALEDLRQLYRLLEASKNFLEGVRVNQIVRLLWGNRSMETEELMLVDRRRYSTDLAEDVIKQYYVSHDPVLFIYELVGNYGRLRKRYDSKEWHDTWQ